MLVQTFIPEPTVKAFYKAILGWLSWCNEVDVNTVGVGPFVKDLARKFWPIVRGNR